MILTINHAAFEGDENNQFGSGNASWSFEKSTLYSSTFSSFRLVTSVHNVFAFSQPSSAVSLNLLSRLRAGCGRGRIRRWVWWPTPTGSA
jgi:hypothetical protein